ncbi:beta-ketoacyl-ACP synthase II [Candidatus Kinetoplastidibacterium crithidiae]|uniref:3-oxoacyl-[acyl-carrier-protein] synthase 2 n=1 Tax=Candidatus Kinetoplastidibacterium crithidiae TCC036E TaxID=1208918 RepID=M1L528_9PROT|nr:beta-ketoacyl-ACP synthase II [Candidatus Kinetoplastibacterium crithidii]AFZ82595.1 3-oxoacyl-[acyl-carrier-protein] synthase II [Candidatus Kinetoplastibacterium crithidii (ex Angomonas deanei ATCC 30255)]AGF47743.1 3-oxoacyl-[acyl-carrier-protein] synthase II [Candidatus Kinetoplastibacterium crithidii TCC036E]
MKRRVVITGLGIVSPVGNNLETAWKNIISGVSGVGKITRFDSSEMPCQIAAEVSNFDIGQYISLKESRHMDTFIHYGFAAANQAWNDSGLVVNDANADRIGVLIGSGIGGLQRIEETQKEVLKKGIKRISPYFVPASLINLISGQVSIEYGFKGPSYAVVSACTTGLHSIGSAARIISYGDADVMLAGGAESTVSPLGIGGFSAMRALSTRNNSPETASRPWDIDRDGFVLGEGAGVLILEEYEHAKKRDARIYGELIGYGMSSDAFHITSPDKYGPSKGIQNALKDASLNFDSINYVNAHGTSTVLGDKNETEALKHVFGSHAKKLVVNSTKSMTGHLLGAAGGVEAVFTTMALYNGISPPTINIFNQDPSCDLDYCANEARDLDINFAISNSFGFGGTNGTIIISKV